MAEPPNNRNPNGTAIIPFADTSKLKLPNQGFVDYTNPNNTHFKSNMKDELEKYYDRINLEAPNTVASYRAIQAYKYQLDEQSQFRLKLFMQQQPMTWTQANYLNRDCTETRLRPLMPTELTFLDYLAKCFTKPSHYKVLRDKFDKFAQGAGTNNPYENQLLLQDFQRQATDADPTYAISEADIFRAFVFKLPKPVLDNPAVQQAHDGYAEYYKYKQNPVGAIPQNLVTFEAFCDVAQLTYDNWNRMHSAADAKQSRSYVTNDANIANDDTKSYNTQDLTVDSSDEDYTLAHKVQSSLASEDPLQEEAEDQYSEHSVTTDTIFLATTLKLTCWGCGAEGKSLATCPECKDKPMEWKRKIYDRHLGSKGKGKGTGKGKGQGGKGGGKQPFSSRSSFRPRVRYVKGRLKQGFNSAPNRRASSYKASDIAEFTDLYVETVNGDCLNPDEVFFVVIETDTDQDFYPLGVAQ